MRPLSAAEIRGTWASLLLPLQDDDSICWTRLGEEIDSLIAARVDGVYSNGTACEFYAQSEAEFDRLHALLAEKCERAGMPWQAGASHTSAQTSLDRVRRVLPLGPGAVQVILPDWSPVSLDEAMRFLARVAEQADPIGIVLYNPPHAKRPLTPAEFGSLARAVPALRGVKVAHSDAEWCAQFRAETAGLSLFVPGHQLATGIAHGAHGSYSNVACLSPGGAVRWNRQAEIGSPEAFAVEARIQRFMTEHIVPFRSHHGIANQGLDKLLAAVGGWARVGTRLRWPYSWVPEAEAHRLQPVARRMIPELFEGESK